MNSSRRAFLWKARRFLLAVAAGCGSLAVAQEPPVFPTLRTAQEIRALSPEAAAEARPVDLAGVITLLEPDSTVFFQDDTGGGFCRFLPKEPPPQPLAVGQRIRVEGVTAPGLFVPGVNPARITVLGPATLPPARPISYAELASGVFHYTRVEMRGIGRAAEIQGDRAVLVLAVEGQRMQVRLPVEHLEQARALVDASVTVRGLAAGFINDRRQLVSPHLRVGTWEDLQVRAPAASADAIPLVRATELGRFAPDGRVGHRQRVQGVVLYAGEGQLYLRDGEFGLLVRGQWHEPLPPGTHVEAVGFAAMGTFSSLLEDAQCRSLHPAAAPSPVPVKAATLLSGVHDADLVSLQAELREVLRTAQGTTLLLRSDGLYFPAHLPSGVPAGDWRPGSRLQLQGVCSVAQTAGQAKGFRSNPAAFELLLRSAEDVAIIQAAGWWTVRKVWAVAAGLFALALLAVGWAAALRSQVRRQTSTIRAQLESRAIAEERQRIAREFHDSVEQGLVALSLQLDATQARLAQEPARGLVETCRRLVHRLQGEGREFIWNLREHTLPPERFEAALYDAISSASTGRAVAASVVVQGTPYALRGVAGHSLVRVAQEAAHNAVHHGRAATLTITAEFGAEHFRLLVQDDGCGFPPDSTPIARPGHFGLQGMRERMQKLGGTLELANQPTGGVRLIAEAPATALRAE